MAETKTKQILARLLEEARLNEEEDLAPEVSKTDDADNANIPDENTEVKPVDVKEDDMIDNDNELDVELKEDADESDDDDEKKECDKDDCDKKEKDDAKDEDESDDDADDEPKELDEEALAEGIRAWINKKQEAHQRKKATNLGKQSQVHETQRTAQSQVSHDKNSERDAENRAARRAATPAEAAEHHRKAADAAKASFKASQTAAAARELKDETDRKAAIATAKANLKKARRDARDDHSKSKKDGYLFDSAVERALFRMFLEDLGATPEELDDEVSKTDDTDNVNIPDENTEVRPIDVKEDDMIDNDNDVDLKEDLGATPEELDDEVSRTDDTDNSNIPDENTEVEPVDVKEDDMIDNDNDVDIELTEEMIMELFDRWRANRADKKAQKLQAKAASSAAAATKAKAGRDKNVQNTKAANEAITRGNRGGGDGRATIVTRADYRNSGTTLARGESRHAGERADQLKTASEKAAKKYGKMAAKSEKKAKIASAKADVLSAKRDQLKANADHKDAVKAGKAAFRAAQKRGVMYEDAELLEELFDMFLEDLGLAEDALEDNPEVLAAAATEGQDPNDVLEPAEAEAPEATDTETALYQLNDKEITESINNIFKYLREEGIDLGTEESKTDNTDNSSIPDENTEVKPVDVKEDDLIKNDNDEDVKLEESVRIRSLKEAYTVDPGYYTRDSKQLITSKDKIQSLTESLAFIEAKNNKDYLFEELLRAVNKVEMLRESIFEKYGEEAASKAEKIAKLTK